MKNIQEIKENFINNLVKHEGMDREEAEEYARFICMDCADLTLCNDGEKDNYYMVQDKLWDEFGVEEGMLCLSCLANRIGRELVGNDFTDCKLNDEMNETVMELKNK